MAGKTKNMSQVKQILRMYVQDVAKQTIAKTLGISKNTVKSYIKRVQNSSKNIEDLLRMDDPILDHFLLTGNPSYKERDRYDVLKELLGKYQKELSRVGVNKQLLWEEYKALEPNGYGRSQFYYHLNKFLNNQKPSMILEHKPGEKLYVDFAGKKLHYVDRSTGEIIDCEVFVACLPHSDYGFAMAVPSQKSEDFICALRKCLEYLGGVPRVIVTDNLKSSVIKSDKYEPTINTILEDFANHYNCVICPTRAYKPKDKALVENSVKLIYSRIYAPLRDVVFFDIHSLNTAILDKLLLHNQKRMQLKSSCREELFLAQEKTLLLPLPKNSFEIQYTKQLTVANNNHILLKPDNHYYSVPYIHIGKKVKIVYNRTMIYIYFEGTQIAVHTRAKGFGYSTNKDHLCSTHQHYNNRSKEYYEEKSKKYSDEFYRLIKEIFAQNRYPEQLYKTCDGLFNLSRKCSVYEFNQACLIALENKQLKYKFVESLIVNKMINITPNTINKSLPKHQNIRGNTEYN